MRDDGRESDNVEDRRGADSGGGFQLPFGGFRGSSIVALLLAAGAAYFFDIDMATVLRLFESGGLTDVQSHHAPRPVASNDKQAKFVSVVLADTEDVWKEIFSQAGKNYPFPKLVLFRGSTPTACGKGKSAMGPFYCPADKKIYIDLGFYDDLRARYKAPGDFAQAYVIAHEVGHHVQNMLGTMRKVRQLQDGKSEAEANALSVKLELQADCYAGIWAHHADKARKVLEQGDVEEALSAASAIGDDTLQRRAGGEVVPESFTHGSSAERVGWFKKGINSGDLSACEMLR